MATTLRFVLLGDDQASRAFDRFARSVDGANRSVARNETALRSQSRAASDANNGVLRLAGAVSGFDAVANASSSKAGMFAKILAGINIATGVGEPLMAGLVVTVGAAASAFSIAGIAAAAYGAAAKPALTQVATAMQAQTKLTQARAAANAQYAASLASGANATTAAAAHTKALDLAQQQYNATMKATPAPVRAFATALQQAKTTYEDWGKRLAAPILRPFTVGLQVVPNVLRAATPLVRGFSNGVEVLIRQLSGSIAGGGLQRWVQSIAPMVGPIVVHLGEAVGHIVTGIGGVIRAFAPMSVMLASGLDKITAKFATWGQTLTGHSGFQALMRMFHAETPMAVQLLHNLGIVIANVARAMTGLASPGNSKALLEALMPVSQLLANLSRNQALVRLIAYMYLLSAAGKQVKPAFTALQTGWVAVTKGVSAGKEAYSVLGRFAGGFRSAQVAESEFSGTAGSLGGQLRTMVTWIATTTAAAYAASLAWIKNTAALVANRVAAAAAAVWARALAAAQWLLNVAMDANPILLIVTALAALVAAFVIAWTHSATFRKILIDAWNAIWQVIKTVAGFITRTAVDIWHRVTAAFGAVLDWVRRNWPWLVGALGGPIGLAVVWIIKHWSVVTGVFQTVITWVRRNWPWLVGALGGPIGLAVVLIVKHWASLMAGIRTTWNAVVGFIRRIPGWILGALGNLGRLLVGAGMALINGFLNGIKSAWTGTANWFRGLGGTVAGYFRGAINWLYQAGRDVITGFFHGLTSVWHTVTSWISSIAGWISAHKGPMGLDSNLLYAHGQAIMHGFYRGLKSKYGQVQSFVSGVGGNVSGWLSTALQATGSPMMWLNALRLLVSKESGGNPTAQNPVTVLGQHATGLLQTLPSTFRAYMMAGHPNILNPIDNAIAAIRYIRATYGSPYNIPGLFGGSYVGYEQGSWKVPRTSSAVVHLGEMVLPASFAEAVRSVLAGRPAPPVTGSDVAVRLDRAVALLGQVVALLRDAPGHTGQAVGDVVNGAAGAALRRGRYSTR